MSIYIKTGQIPFPLPYGHRISILADGHAYYEDGVSPFLDLGEVIPVLDHGDLIDRTTVKDFWLYADWDTGMDMGKEKNAFAVINSVPTIIPADYADKEDGE